MLTFSALPQIDVPTHAPLLWMTMLLVHHLLVCCFSDAFCTFLRREWQKRLGSGRTHAQWPQGAVFVAKGKLLEGRGEPLTL